ncbi:hypothetical protein KCM76_16190 [Zooshikella marina]|uniref:hypothetical protein n=1 Tax=Zooshikella ganghwensis TaxID=202772 RepID=UPI001BAE9F5B|nr:hypothetical protein [Zooshikella ganghwensis]MBU2707535.1 hypothetical protein [Zooshikella ganghwensis]
MLGQLIMNGNGAIGHASGSVISNGIFKIISQPNELINIEGKKIYTGPLQFSFVGGDANIPGLPIAKKSVHTFNPAMITPTSVKMLVGKQKPIRENDKGFMMVNALTMSGLLVSLISPMPVIVKSAGQRIFTSL